MPREIFAHLPQSLTHDVRFFRLVPAVGESDGYLTIQQGEEGPRGGRSKISIESYGIQEVESDPQDQPFPGRAFLVAKDSRAADVYEVWIPRQGVAVCNCTGFRTHKTCKHCDVFVHLCFIEMWCPDDFRELPTAGRNIPAATVA